MNQDDFEREQEASDYESREGMTLAAWFLVALIVVIATLSFAVGRWLR